MAECGEQMAGGSENLNKSFDTSATSHSQEASANMCESCTMCATGRGTGKSGASPRSQTDSRGSPQCCQHSDSSRSVE